MRLDHAHVLQRHQCRKDTRRLKNGPASPAVLPVGHLPEYDSAGWSSALIVLSLNQDVRLFFKQGNSIFIEDKVQALQAHDIPIREHAKMKVEQAVPRVPRFWPLSYCATEEAKIAFFETKFNVKAEVPRTRCSPRVPAQIKWGILASANRQPPEGSQSPQKSCLARIILTHEDLHTSV
jgi:hypothetical protein